MRIGFTSVTFRNKTPEEICQLAKDNGVQYIEWGADVHVRDEAEAQLVRSLCDQYGIQTITLGSYYRIGDQNLEAFEHDCKSAKILGAERIRVWAGRVSSEDTDDELFERYITDATAISDIAATYGLCVGMEYHKKTYNDSPASGKKLMDACGKTNFKTMWQPFSFENDMDTLYGVLDSLCEVHVFAWNKEYIRFPLSMQENEWAAFLSVFSKKQPDCILEFVKDDSPEQFSCDYQFFRQLSEKF